jgi:hypothetical protein
MNALVDSRSFLDVIAARFALPKPSAPQVKAMPEKPFNPFSGLSLADLRSLRRTLVNAAHLAHVDDAAILYDRVDERRYRHATNEEGVLPDLARTCRTLIDHRYMGEYGFGVRVYQSRITGEFGLMVIRIVDDVPVEKLHGLPQYERLHTSMEIPTTLSRFFTDEVDIVSYSVRCFLRRDQLQKFDEVADLLKEIEVALGK